jgi:hypothetical protein
VSRGRGATTREKEGGLVKDMVGDDDTVGVEGEAPIAFVVGRVAEKDAHGRARG